MLLSTIALRYWLVSFVMALDLCGERLFAHWYGRYEEYGLSSSKQGKSCSAVDGGSRFVTGDATR